MTGARAHASWGDAPDDASRTPAAASRLAAWPAALLCGVALACGDRSRTASDTARPDDRADVPLRQASDASSDTALVRATRGLVAFLRAEAPLDSLALADTVALRVAPEGGGSVTRVARSALRERAAWTVTVAGRRMPLVPPASHASLVLRAGRHFACQEQALSTRAPDLASRPHVGVRLQPEGAESCLQSWNATFVFDTVGGGARLDAVVYDQWEW